MPVVDFIFGAENLPSSGNLLGDYRSLLGSLQTLGQETEASSQLMSQWESLARQVVRGVEQQVVRGVKHQVSALPQTEVEASPSSMLYIDGRPSPIPLLDTLTIGRNKDNDLVLDDTNVSRHHARLEPRGEAWWLVDLGSSNGTYLNGQRLSAPAQLRDGDQGRIGDTTFKLVYSGANAAYDANATVIEKPPMESAKPEQRPAARAAAPAQVQEKKTFCRNCGQPLKAGAHFCRNCGQNVS